MTYTNWDGSDAEKQKTCHESAYQQLVALLYIQNADQHNYGSVIISLASQFALEQNHYPQTLTHAMSNLSDHKFNPKYNENRKNKGKLKSHKEYKKDNKNKPKEDEKSDTELNFAQLEGYCYCCGKKGHHSPEFPKKDKIAKIQWEINKTAEATFIQLANRTLT
jgi:hypothetical protein